MLLVVSRSGRRMKYLCTSQWKNEDVSLVGLRTRYAEVMRDR